ncbi:MAG: acyl--CoA ligase [Lachnospiraceae bacterium]|nr:acyl--CoA ligase [Lachnospiraceae bacterium]
MFSEETNVFYEKYEQFKFVRTTYGEAKEEILRRSRALKALLPDAPAQAVVGLAMPNSLSWLENYWAILAAGFRPMLMNLRLDKETLEEALAGLHAAAVVSEEERYAVRTVTEAELASAAESSDNDPSDAETGSSGSGAFGDAFFVMSSGTSEHVKLCAYTAEQLYSILLDSEEIVANSPSMQKHYRGQLKQLTFLPFYHIFGFVAVYLWFGFFARTFVELRDYAPETILTTIRRHGVTHIFAVPLFWEKVYTAALRTIKDRGAETYRKFEKGMRIAGKLSFFPPLYRLFANKAFAEVRKNLFGESISLLISGGGEIRPEVLRFFNRIGYHLANGYGMSEIGIASVDLSENPAELEFGSVGRPFSSYEYRIEDGLLYVRGQSLAAYVLSDGRKLESGEWFPTGDLAAERNGSYFIEGRNDDLIVDASGENLNPNLIEPKLLVPGVRGIVLSPVREGGTVTPVLVAEVAPFLSDEKLKTIDGALRARLEEVKVRGAVRRIVYTDEPLIRGEEFKLNRKRIAKELEEGTFTERSLSGNALPEGEEDRLLQTLRVLFAEALQKTPEEIGCTADFFTELGGSSLDYLLLLSKVRETFGVALKQESGESFHTLERMEKELRKRIDDLDLVL